MSAPLVVNTRDGMCWTRRTVTSSGIALYAPEGVCGCPEFVMATLAELAEHGIAGSADVLPVPVGPTVKDEHSPIAALIGDAKPARDGLLLQLAESVRDRREHDHSTQREDWYCMNLTSFMGERMGPVLRRLLDAEARVAELEAERHTTNEALDDAVRELRTPYAERARRERDPGRRLAWRMLAQCEESERVANALLTPEAARSADKLRALLAGQREAVDGEHYAAVHHSYRVPRDLPETGGATQSDPEERLLEGDELRQAVRGHLFGGAQ